MFMSMMANAFTQPDVKQRMFPTCLPRVLVVYFVTALINQL